MALAAFLSPIQRQIQAGKFIACSRIGPPNHCYWNASVSTHWPTSIHNSASLTSNSRICKSHKHNKRAKRSSYFQLGGRRKRSSITGIPIVLNSTKMIRNIYSLKNWNVSRTPMTNRYSRSKTCHLTFYRIEIRTNCVIGNRKMVP